MLYDQVNMLINLKNLTEFKIVINYVKNLLTIYHVTFYYFYHVNGIL